MRGLRFLILAVAIAAGVGAVALVRNELERAKRPIVAQQTPAPQARRVEVLVAARELKMGERLKGEDLRWQPWPQEAVSEFFLTKQAQPRALEDMEGVIVRSGLLAGEPLSDSKLIRLKQPSVMAGFVRRGMVAFGLKVDEVSAAGGFILPGDYVDVIMTARVEIEVEDLEAEGGVTAESVLLSKTVLRSVRVLAIDEIFQQSGDPNIEEPKTATLEVTPDQAEALALAERGGEIQLALRSVAELIPETGQRPIDPVPVLAYDPRHPEELPEADAIDIIRFNAKQSLIVE